MSAIKPRKCKRVFGRIFVYTFIPKFLDINFIWDSFMKDLTVRLTYHDHKTYFITSGTQ